MGSLHNLRFLRFLIVLSAVVLTIFIYASYSSSTSLTPPHMRAGTPTASALSGQDHHNQQHVQLAFDPAAAVAVSNNKSYIGSDTYVGAAAESASYRTNGSVGAAANVNTHNIHATHNAPKVIKKPAAISLAAASNGVILAKKPFHREPTIDVDAVAGGAGNALDEVPDEAALERFVNNDLLEEQYGQNVDNMLGNINNSNVTGAVVQSQQQQQQPDEQQRKQQNQLADNNNNLNKILDSDVLIPTSNLQKFIENADKILKNITVNSPPATTNIKSSDKDETFVAKAEEAQDHHEHPNDIDPSGNNNKNDIDNDIALPPSVVMTIKHGSASAAEKPPPQPAVATKTNKSKVTPKSNATVHASVDPTNGIPTQQIYESGHMNEEVNIAKLCPNEGADLKLLILITSAQAHADARLAIRQTWAHYGIRRDVSTAFILGRSTNETLNIALTQENFIYGDLIRGNFIDSYNNLTLKTVSALEWVDTHCSRAKYILKTDDDMFINVPKLLTFLDNHSKEKRVIYGRLAKKWKPIRNKKSKYYVSTGQFGAPVFPPFTTGPAYVISSDIIHELYKRSLHQVYLKLEDVFTTGIVAQQLNIKRVHVNEFLNRRIAFNPCNIRKTISVHMIKSNEQFDLWKKLLDQTTKCK